MWPFVGKEIETSVGYLKAFCQFLDDWSRGSKLYCPTIIEIQLAF